MMNDRWLQWELTLEREHNCITVSLVEYTKGKDDKWPTTKLIGRHNVRIYYWSDETSICRRLNQTQEKLLKKYAKFYKKWDRLSKVIRNFVGGRIVIDDAKTNQFIGNLK